MLNSPTHAALSVLIVALLCAGCTNSTTVNSNTQSPRQPSTYEAEPKKKSPPATFDGRVVSILDGDTILVVHNARLTHEVRLQGIDAPEGGQAFGDMSHQNLSDIASGKHVEIQWSKRDRYGRIVGKVLVDGADVCLQQIQDGMAWHYKHFQNEQSAADRELYANAEVEARSVRRGLWNDQNPLPPWRFRRAH